MFSRRCISLRLLSSAGDLGAVFYISNMCFSSVLQRDGRSVYSMANMLLKTMKAVRKRIGILVEGWVLEVVVVDGNENGKTDQTVLQE